MDAQISLGLSGQNQAAKCFSPLQDGTLINNITDPLSNDVDAKEQRIYSLFTKKQLNNLISEANKLLNPELTETHYVLHDKLNQYYVQVEDTVTHKVIREIPPKKFMDMYAAIAEKLGLIVNKRI